MKITTGNTKLFNCMHTLEADPNVGLSSSMRLTSAPDASNISDFQTHLAKISLTASIKS